MTQATKANASSTERLKHLFVATAITGLGVAAVGGTMVAAAGPAVPPLVKLAEEPLYMNGANTKANLMLAISVEFPTVGQTYRDDFNPARKYIGYFDPDFCYNITPASYGSSAGPYMSEMAKAGTTKVGTVSVPSCGGGQINGNLLNWATSSAIDIMRFGLTGGNRVIDDDKGNGQTVLERAWLPDDFYRNDSYFKEKFLPKNLADAMLPSEMTIPSTGVYIYNCRDRMYILTERDTTGTCAAPFNVADITKDKRINKVGQYGYLPVRMEVCKKNSAANRLMSYDPDNRKWSGLCYPYGGWYKPVGQLQVNADNIRVGVTGYLQDDARARYGGVLRAPLKYVGQRHYDALFKNIAGVNPVAEWDATTGVLKADPQGAGGSYPNQGFSRSGAINYLNKFGTLGFATSSPDNTSRYKAHDPVSELYYETLRYLQGKQPTPDALETGSRTADEIKALKEYFPAYGTWVDPFQGFQDATGDATCLRNSILTIGDVFTHSDKSIPGNTRTGYEDFARDADTNPDLDVMFWTSVVGSFESKSSGGVSYTDSKGRSQTANNLAANHLYPALADAATVQTGSTGGAYYIAGLAYWANTHSFRTDLPKGRVSTYTIDVNERRQSLSEDPTVDTTDFRRTRQLYLAAKYGGFRDADHTGNPFQGDTNVLWQGTDGDAKNYFVVSDAQRFLDSIAEVFAKVVEETGSIAGGALSSQQLRNAEVGAAFQARFNPVANFWSGKLEKYSLTVNADGSDVTMGTSPTWEAGRVLTAATKADKGAGRNIFVGPSPDRAVAATEFVWAKVSTAVQNSLKMQVPQIDPATGNVVKDAAGNPVMVDDGLSQARLAYLRGDQSNEQSPSNQTGQLRPRDSVLGAIVNSGLVYMGKPSTSISGSGYTAFFNANKSRAPVVFVNANDGMLHAFKDSDGSEVFAYVPGFLATRLRSLTTVDYSYAPLADATPAVGEAYFDSKWHSVLVSGVGGGAQGVYALDVTDPTQFSKANASAANNVLWEFTDRDSPELGYVLGSPKILKMRKKDKAGTTAADYGYYAVFMSGVNNHDTTDGKASATGNPSLFILDLATKPTATNGWVEGTNFWRVQLPQSSTAQVTGAINFSVDEDYTTGAVQRLYAGDLQGNVWALDFSDTDAGLAGAKENGIAGLTNDALKNLKALNALSTTVNPMFVARTAANALQPITAAPVITNSPLPGVNQISFATGKFLETSDLDVATHVQASFYSVLDSAQAKAGISVSLDDNSPNKLTTKLAAGTNNGTTGAVTIPSIAKWGYPASPSATEKMGYYFNFDNAAAEREISEIKSSYGVTMFGTIYPTRGACGEGGGRTYLLDALTGSGASQESQVGILSTPLFVEIGNANSTRSNVFGQRISSKRFAVINQGAKGTQILRPSSGKLFSTPNLPSGMLSWRQINNFQENR